MKDNKKKIFIIASVIIILLICLLGIRHCEKQKERPNKDNEIVNPSDEEDQTNNNTGNEDNNVDEVVVPTNNQETSKPTITLNGSDLIYVEINSTYQEEGANASDQKYGDLTKEITVNNPLDLSKLGTYYISYTVTNQDGESATVTRTVVVQDTISPTIQYSEGIKEGQIVLVDANKSEVFENHAVVTDDNSKGIVTLETTYYYKEQLEEEYVEVESLDLSRLGYYEVHYVAVDESMNRSKEVIVVEYQVRDVTGPIIQISENGTDYKVTSLSVDISAEDAYTEVVSFTYAWVTSLEEEPIWKEVTTSTLPVENGDHYLLLKAVDAFGNESKLTSELFQIDETLMEATNFNLHSGTDYSGVNAGIKINQLTDISDIEFVTVKLYSDTTLLATNTSTSKIKELSLTDNSIELSTPFIVKEGTYVEEYWTTVQNSEYRVDLKPTKVVFEIVKTNGEIHTLENNNLVEPGIYWESNFYDYDILVGQEYGNYQTVAEAVMNAMDGDTILVLPGEYDGTVNIDKNITIYGLNRETTILTNTQDENAVIQVNSPVTVEMKNLTLSGNDTVSGSVIQNATVTMENMIITHVSNAIDVAGQSDVTVSNSHLNNVMGEEGKGYIDVTDQSNVVVSDTTIIANEDAKENGNVGIYYHGEETTGSVNNGVMINFDTAIGYEGQEPITDNNTYVNCNNEVVTLETGVISTP